MTAIFLDRDGTINEDRGYISRPEDLSVYPWAAEAVRLINLSGMKAIVVTNQSGIARGFYSEEDLAGIHEQLIAELESRDARIDSIYYCPHHPRIGDHRYQIVCECRKPSPGMLRCAEREHQIELGKSWIIGDKASDINLAPAVGARSALVMTGYGRETLARRDLHPCEPDVVAENLLEAVRLILSGRA